MGLEGFGDGADEGTFAAGAVDPPVTPPTEPLAEFPPAPAACANDAIGIPSARPNTSTITNCFFILTRCSKTLLEGQLLPLRCVPGDVLSKLTNASILNPYFLSHLLSMMRVSFVFLKFRPTMRAPPAMTVAPCVHDPSGFFLKAPQGNQRGRLQARKARQSSVNFSAC